VSESTKVKRPAILALAIFGFAAAALALGAGLIDISMRRAAGPAIIAVDKDDLEAAIEDAPWISSGNTNGPVLWIITAPGCEACRTFQKAQMPRLLDAGVEVRALLVAPRSIPLGTRDAKDVATLLKQQEWQPVELWLQGKREQANGEMELAEEEGLLEWSRQASEQIGDVLARNDLKAGRLVLLWRHGVEWRAIVSGDKRGFSELEDDLMKQVRSGA
jgi:hypothetical protein